MKKRPLAAAAAAVAVLATAVGTATAAPRSAAPEDCSTLAGSTVTLTTDVGLVEKFTYSADATQLTATILQPGPFPLTVGDTIVQAISTAKVGANSYMVSWVESSGLTVSSVQNLDKDTAQLFWTYPTDDQGTRVGEQHTGTLVCDHHQ